MSGNLNHSAADVVAQLLVDLSVGVRPEDGTTWPIFVGYQAEAADNVITIYNTAGSLHGRHQVGGETQQHYGIQARVRGADEDTGFVKAQGILNSWDGVDKNVVRISSSVYLVQAVHATTGVIPVGLESEASRRKIFTVNALAALRLTS